MTTASRKPWLKASAAVLHRAIRDSGVSRSELAAALGRHISVVTTMSTARSIVTPEAAEILGPLLGIDPWQIISPPNPNRPVMGPAQRAVMLHEQAQAAAPPAPPPVPARIEVLPPESVFGMEARRDGTSRVWLNAVMPADRAAILFRLLLDMDLT